MSESDKITIKDIIHYVSVILLGFFLFFGFIYYFEGNIIFSAVGTFIAIAFLGIGLTHILVKLKTVTQYHKKMMLWEILVFVLGYVILFVMPSGYFIAKLVTVEFSEKEKVQTEMLSQIEEISNMFEEYEEHVNNKANNYEVELKNNGESNSSINSKLIILNETLKNTDYNSINNIHGKFVAESKRVINDWNRLKLAGVLNENARLKQNWYSELVDISDNHQSSNEFGVFEYDFVDNEVQNLLNPPLKGTNWFLVGFVLLILHGLILWPYFFAQRTTRPKSDGIKDEGLVM